MTLLGEIVFRGGMAWYFAYPLMALGVAAVVAVYLRESIKLHPGKRIAMAAMRCLAIIVIIFLLRKPVIVREGDAETDRPIALLIDNSQSMAQADPRPAAEDLARVGIVRNILPPDNGLEISSQLDPRRTNDDGQAINPTRARMVMDAFENPRLNLREELRKKGPLQEFLFGANIHGAGKDWQSDLKANESLTALLYSIGQLLQRDDNELPGAIVIATDGIDNDRDRRIPWEEIGRECARLKVPLHIYGVGGGSARLLKLKNVDSNPRDTLIVKDTVRVTFRWTCQGIKSGRIELTVKLAGNKVASKQIDVKEGDEITETLTFVPTEEMLSPTKQDLEGTIHLVGGRPEDEDKMSRPVRVVDSKVKVLVIDDSPRWEFKHLMRVLLRDRAVDEKESRFVLVNGDERTLKSGPPFLPTFPKERKDFFNFDLVIIGDVDANYFTSEQKKWIVEFVDEGGGLVMIAGRKHNPSTYHDNIVGNILPVEFEQKKFALDDNKRPIEFNPRLSDFGRYDVMMSLADSPPENLDVWEKLPPWYWHYPVTKLKPAAQSLLEHPKETIDDYGSVGKERKVPMPLMARQYYGRGIVMFVASDETWRWRFNEADKYFGRFWGQVVYQLGLPHVLGGKTQLIADGDFFKGKPTKVYARLYGANHTPLDAARYAATIEPTGAKTDERSETVYFEKIEGQPGLYMTTIAKNQTGDYTLKMNPSSDSTSALSMPMRVTLTPEDEQAPGNMNESALRQLAEQTGGKFYREEDLKDLAKSVERKTVRRDPPPREEVLLWTRWWVLASIVGLLTVEWLIRKFSNLS